MVLGFGRRSRRHSKDEGGQDGGHHHHHDHRRPRESRAHRVVTAVTALFTLATLVLFLLVGLGSPIIKSVWLLTLKAKPANPSIITSIATQIRFGTWGYCAVGENGAQLCVGPRLGYSLTDPINIAALLAEPMLTNAITKALTIILVLHPICAALALLVFLVVLIPRHSAAIGALVVAIVLAIVSSVSLAIDLTLVAMAKARVPAATDGNFSVEFANGAWMVLAAVVCAWISVIAISVRACMCCGVRSKF